MNGLSFGEQVKIVLKRKGMTIKQLAQELESATGRKTSRQNLTQKLGRDNFQEQDMREIAEVLGCPFSLSILGDEMQYAYPSGRKYKSVIPVKAQPDSGVWKKEKEQPSVQTDMQVNEPETAADDAKAGESAPEQELTIGEIYELHSELEKLEREMKALDKPATVEDLEKKKQQVKARGLFLKKTFLNGLTKRRDKKEESERDFEPVITYEDDLDEDLEKGELNPKTGHEYYSNSVRMHPTLIGYVQVYDRMDHSWTDMTEWAFLAYQERKQALLGDDYEPPIYLD